MARSVLLAPEEIIAEVNSAGAVIVGGWDALRTVRDAIKVLDATANLFLEFDPASDPDLSDYLAVGGLSAIKGAALGSVIGLIAGSFMDRPAHGLLAGAGAGALLGVLHGAARVEIGWRVKAWRGADGTPQIEIERT